MIDCPFPHAEKVLFYTLITLREVKIMPSEKILEQKKQRVGEITELLKNATAGVVVDYKGISVEADFGCGFGVLFSGCAAGFATVAGFT